MLFSYQLFTVYTDERKLKYAHKTTFFFVIDDF